MTRIPDRKTALRVRRDSWTRLLYLQLGAFAFFLYAFSPAIGFLRDDLHLSAGVAGLHGTAYAIGVTAGGASAPWYITRAGGSRSAVWLGLVGLSAAVALFCAVPVLAATLSAAMVCGVFGAWVCIAVPAALARAHGSEAGPAAITEANAVAAFVGIAAPLAVGGAAAAGIGWRTALLGVAPLSGVLYLVLGRVREPEWLDAGIEQVVLEPELCECGVRSGGGELAAGASGGSVIGSGELFASGEFSAASREFGSSEPLGTADLSARIPAPRSAEPIPQAAESIPRPSGATGLRTLPRRFWVNQVAGVCAGAIEFSLTLWCATLLRDRAHLSAGAAATGVTAIVAGMAAGRAAGGRLALRFSIDHLIFAAFATNLLGFAVFWLTANPVLMFAGLAIAGLGVSLQYPLISARGIELSGGRAELAGAVSMFGAGIAIGIAPFVLGVLSDRFGIHAAYLLVPVFIATATGAIAASRAPSESMAA